MYIILFYYKYFKYNYPEIGKKYNFCNAILDFNFIICVIKFILVAINQKKETVEL